MNPAPVAKSLAQLVGAHRVFAYLAREVARQVVANAHGPNEPATEAEARQIHETLLQLYPAFDCFYARLFIKHVGEQDLPALIAELEGEPMQAYLRARAAIKPALAVGLQRLRMRMGESDL